MNVILTAIDDNDSAWYEMVVPFLVSLRRTDNAADVGILDYGLSARKLAILSSEGIKVFPCDRGGISLACDRYLAAAAVLERHPEYSLMALYDADIWFADKSFDLFDHIADGDNISACLDVWASLFVTNPIIGGNRDALAEVCLGGNESRYGGIFQAGLLAGSRSAWTRLAAFMQNCLTKIGEDFRDIYGLDTTLLNLYSGFGNFNVLNKRFNCVPKHGVKELPDHLFATDTGVISGLHMTGDSRAFHRWRFFNVHSEEALREGARFALCEPAAMSCRLAEAPEDFIEALDQAGWRLRALQSDNDLQCLFSQGGFFGRAQKQSPVFIARGSAEITLEATRLHRRAEVLTSYSAISPTPVALSVAVDGGEWPISYPAYASWRFEAGQSITLKSRSLAGHHCEMFWGIEDRA